MLGRILLVEDEENVARLVQRALALEGYTVTVARDGRRAIQMFDADRPDLLILDLTLPGMDGLEVCRRLRSSMDASEARTTPILMLTGRDAVRDRVTGLGAGADDYLVKPFALQELAARIHALLRRAHAAPGAGDRLHCADLDLELPARVAIRGARGLDLSTREYDLLATLCRAHPHVLTQDQLLARVWGPEFDGQSNVVAVVVASLRREMEAAGEPRLVQTVRGVGYVLREEA